MYSSIPLAILLTSFHKDMYIVLGRHLEALCSIIISASEFHCVVVLIGYQRSKGLIHVRVPRLFVISLSFRYDVMHHSVKSLWEWSSNVIIPNFSRSSVIFFIFALLLSLHICRGNPQHGEISSINKMIKCICGFLKWKKMLWNRLN